MPEDTENLINAFGNALVRRDHEALDVLLAPWISVAAALEVVGSAVRSMAEDWDVSGDVWPTAAHGSTGSLDYEALRAHSDFPPGRDIPVEVDRENYAGWCVVTLEPSADDESIEFDAYCDIWFAAVRLPDGLHVGSIEAVDPD